MISAYEDIGSVILCMTKSNSIAFLLVFLITYTVVSSIKIGDIILQHSFDGTAEEATWNRTLGPLIQLVPTERGNKALRIERKQQNGSSTMIPLPLPVFALRGYKIRIQVDVKAANISTPPNAWNGIKIMLYSAGLNGSNYPQFNMPQGTFNWRTVFYVDTIPFDAQQAALHIGLEAVTGTVWFDDLKVSIYSKSHPFPPLPPPAGAPYKGHNLSRLRGAMIGTNLNEQDFRDFAGWNANHIRWQLLWNGFPHSPADNGDIPAYEAWLESALARLDSMLPICRQLGLHILVDLHTPPGGRDQNNRWPLFREKRFQDTFLKA